jgi:hypothetical protein
MYRLAGLFVPNNRRFALICKADAGNFARFNPRRCDALRYAFQLGCEDFHRVVLNPARLWKVLRELLLPQANGGAGGIKYDGPTTRRPLVQAEDVAHNGPPKSITDAMLATPAPFSTIRNQLGGFS